MEFRCRLGTPGGDIIEGIYVAESEARLRRELEEKGLYVLAIKRAGAGRIITYHAKDAVRWLREGEGAERRAISVLDEWHA